MAFKGYKTTNRNSLTGDYSKEIAADVQRLGGTKYAHIGSSRKGWGSVLDSKIAERNIKRDTENMGKGYVQFVMLNDKGGAATETPLNIGDRVFFPDADGKFTIVDEALLDKELQMENEKREYISGVIKRASISDALCQLVLGFSDDKELNRWLGANSSQILDKLDDDLRRVDARPSRIDSYAKSGITYSNALTKFRIVCNHRCPIINNLTPSDAKNAD